MTKARDIASAAPAPAGVTSTELGYVDGVTSAIQTQVDAKIAKTLTTTTGDIIYASGANTPARLGIGSSAQVLTVSGGVPSWATPSSGGMTVIASGSIANSPTGFSITTIPATYTNLQLVIRNSNSGANNINSRLRFNNLATGIYSVMQNYGESSTTGAYTEQSGGSIVLDNNNSSRGTDTSVYVVNIWDYAGNSFKTGAFNSFHQVSTGANYQIVTGTLGARITSAINQIDFVTGNANSFSAAGTYTLYGVK